MVICLKRWERIMLLLLYTAGTWAGKSLCKSCQNQLGENLYRLSTATRSNITLAYSDTSNFKRSLWQRHESQVLVVSHACTCTRIVNFTKRWKSLATGSDEEMDVFYHILSGAVLVVAVTIDVLRISLSNSEWWGACCCCDYGNHYFALIVIVARVPQERLRCAALPLAKRRSRANVLSSQSAIGGATMNYQLLLVEWREFLRFDFTSAPSVWIGYCSAVMPVLRIVSCFNQSEIMFPELAEIRIPDNVAWDDFQNAVHIVVARKLEIPARFVVLVWPAECARDSPQTACSTVGVVLSPPEYDIPEYEIVCQCCADPCKDADKIRIKNAVGSREWNCMRCEPCFLCSNCRIQLESLTSFCEQI